MKNDSRGFAWLLQCRQAGYIECIAGPTSSVARLVAPDLARQAEFLRRLLSNIFAGASRRRTLICFVAVPIG